MSIEGSSVIQEKRIRMYLSNQLNHGMWHHFEVGQYCFGHVYRAVTIALFLKGVTFVMFLLYNLFISKSIQLANT